MLVARRLAALSALGLIVPALVLFLAAAHPIGAQQPESSDALPWVAETGGFNSLVDVAAISATDIHAVGSNLVHSDGQRWRSVDGREVPAYYAAVDFVGSDEGWAVGHEVAVPYGAGAWGDPVALPGIQLADVELTAPGQGWAVGWDGPGKRAIVLRLADGAWRSVPIAGDVPRGLVSLWMASSSDGWAVHADTAVHYDGTSWTAAKLPGVTGLRAVSGTAADDVWAVGGPEPSPFGDTAPGFILHYDGTNWSAVRDAPFGGLADVAVRAGDGYAVGFEGNVLRFRDGHWDELGKLIDARRLYQVTDVEWVPGTAYALVALSDGRVYRLEDGRATLAWNNAAVSGIAMASPRLGWAVGWAGALEYDGARWTPVDATSPLHKANDVAAVGPSDAWAVGVGGRILHFDGGSWQAVASPVTVTLDRVRMVSSTLGWAVGNGVTGTVAAPISLPVVLRYDGHAWRTVWARSTTVYRPLFDVHGTSSDDAWVADPDGLWHFDGESWTQWPIERCCRSVAMASEREGGAGGERGIFRFNGSDWLEDAWVPATVDAITVQPDGSGLAVGWLGYVLHRNGSQWRIVRGPIGLYGVPWGLGRLATIPDGATVRMRVAGEQQSILTADLVSLLRRPPITPDPGETAVPFTPIADDTSTPTVAIETPVATASPHSASGLVCLPWLARERP